MPMTRELKKRFGAVEERIGKLEKKKSTQRTNGEDLAVQEVDASLIDRLDNIEAVLQIPGEKVGDNQVLSAWRQIVENKLQNIETVMVMPGPNGFLSGFAAQVDKVMTSLKERVLKLEHRGSWTPEEGKTLDARVKTLWDRPSAESFKVFIKMIEERVQKLEQIPEPASDVTTALEKRVQHLEQIPDPAATVLEFDDRLRKLEKKTTPIWVKDIETKVRDLQTRDRMLTKEMNDNRPTLKKHEDRLHSLEKIIRSDFPIKVFGKPFTEWIKFVDDRIGELERKPVAGTLSNIAQDMNRKIEGNNKENKALRSLVLKAIWIVSGILAVMTVAQFLTNVLP